MHALQLEDTFSSAPHAMHTPAVAPRPRESGVQPTWARSSGSDADPLGTAAFIAATKLNLLRDEDGIGSVTGSIGGSALRAAAWLRSRGASVGHAVTRARLDGEDGHHYDLLSRAHTGRGGSAPVRIGRLRSCRLADWLGRDRVAILLVGPGWPTAGDQPHALVAMAGSPETIAVFDPRRSALDDLTFRQLDAFRFDPTVGGEILLASRRRSSPR